MTERDKAAEMQASPLETSPSGDEYLRQYVEALHDERLELRGELESIRRRGVSPSGRVVLARVVRVVIAIVVVTLVYLLGRASV